MTAAAEPVGRRDLMVDAGLAALVALAVCGGVVGEAAAAPPGSPPAAGGYLLGIAAAAVLTWRRRRPVPVAVAALGLAAAYPLLGYHGFAPLLALFMACYSLACYARDARAVFGSLAICLMVWAIPVLPPQRWPPTSPAVWAPVASMAWISLLGASVRRRRLENEGRVRRSAEAAEARTRERLAAERLRIARELHDVLAHTISVIAVQSGVASDALGADPARDAPAVRDVEPAPDIEAARRALATIRGSTRQAMAELRASLELLRGDDAGEPGGSLDRAPQPGLDRLEELAGRARAAGLAVTLDVADVADVAGVAGVAGAGGELDPAVQLAVYRVVQEALTNVVRHAGAASVTVAVHRTEGAVEVRVADDGRGPGGHDPGFGVPHRPSGFGMRGMRERVESLGGVFSAGPGPGGGFVVEASIPV